MLELGDIQHFLLPVRLRWQRDMLQRIGSLTSRNGARILVCPPDQNCVETV